MKIKWLAALAAAVWIAAPASAGVYFKSITRTEGAAGPHGAGGGSMVTEGWASGDRAKVEFKESGNPMMGAGSYILAQGGSHQMVLVNPKDKTYMVWDMDAMMSGIGGMMQAMKGMMSMKFTDPKTEVLADEAGPEMLGHPTHHYKTRTSYTMEMAVFGMKTRTKTLREADLWTAELPDLGLRAWLRPSGIKTGDPEFDKLMHSEVEKIHGMPLKMVSVSTATDDKGKTQVTKMNMEVTEMRATDVPDSTFALPSGYKEINPLEGMPHS